MSSHRKRKREEDNDVTVTTKKDRIDPGKMDPISRLNEECMFHVLSFLWAENHDNEVAKADSTTSGFGASAVSIRKVALQLKSVSPKWARLVQKASGPLSPRLLVDFDAVPESAVESFSAWLCSVPEFRIQSIVCACRHNQPFVARVLQGCNTSQLTSARLRLFLPDDTLPSPSPLSLKKQGASPRRVRNAISSQQALQNSLAECCPKLESLSISLQITGSGIRVEDYLHPTLFSRSSLVALLLEVDHAPSVAALDYSWVSQVVENLPLLEKLELRSPRSTLVPTAGSKGAFHIASRSLKTLDVENFCTQHVKLSLDCPQLDRIICRGRSCHGKIFVRQKIVQAQNIPEECRCVLEMGPPQELPFHQLLGDNVHFLHILFGFFGMT